MYCCHISHTLVKTTLRILAQQIRRPPKKERKKKVSSYYDVNAAAGSFSLRTDRMPLLRLDPVRGTAARAGQLLPSPRLHLHVFWRPRGGRSLGEWRPLAGSSATKPGRYQHHHHRGLPPPRHPEPCTTPDRPDTTWRSPGWMDGTIRYASMYFGHYF